MRWRTSIAKQSTICCMSIFVIFEFKVAESKERYIYLILSSSSLISSLLLGQISFGCYNFSIKRWSNLFASCVWQIWPEAWERKSWMMEVSSRAPTLTWVIDFLRWLRPAIELSLVILGGLLGNYSLWWLVKCVEFLFLMRNLDVVFYDFWRDVGVCFDWVEVEGGGG